MSDTSAMTYDLDAKRRWACGQLEVTEAGDAATNAAILKRLADEEFVPPPGVREAVRTLCTDESSAATDPLGEYSAALEQDANEEIEQFANDFFKTPTGVRACRLEELFAREGLTAPQRNRLNLLSRGVYVDLPDNTPGGYHFRQLTQLIAELFVLHPVVRRHRIRQELAKMNHDGGEFAAAARQVENCGAFAELLPRFLRDVADLDPFRQRQQKRAQQQMREAAEQAIVPQLAGESANNDWTWVTVFAIAGFIGLGLAMSRDNDSRLSGRSGYSSPAPEYTPSAETERALRESLINIRKAEWNKTGSPTDGGKARTDETLRQLFGEKPLFPPDNNGSQTTPVRNPTGRIP